MFDISKVDIYTDGSYRADTPDLTRGGIIILFNDEPYIFVKLTTHKPGFTKSRNVGGELLAAAMALNMAHTELEKFKNSGFKTPPTMTLYHDYEGINNMVRPDPKSGVQWKKLTTECSIFYKMTFDKLNDQYPTNTRFKWVKSHNKNKWNEVVDVLAKGYWPDGYSKVYRQEVNL